MTTLFISDLHLADAHPGITQLLFGFLRGPARNADSLYILGDLFEYWAGDDDLDEPLNRDVAAALREVADHGVKTYFMAGNRDFLIGDDFARRSGLTLLPDPTLIDLDGTPTLLMHGDTLCTDDAAYHAVPQHRAHASLHRAVSRPAAGGAQGADRGDSQSQRSGRSRPRPRTSWM